MRWSFLLAGIGALLFFVGVSTIRETYQGWKVEQEIQGLQTQVETLEGKKLRLSETLQRLQAPDAVDKEARLRLGLQKPGERVFIVPSAEALARAGQTAGGATVESVELSNPQKWFRYFFVHL